MYTLDWHGFVTSNNKIVSVGLYYRDVAKTGPYPVDGLVEEVSNFEMVVGLRVWSRLSSRN